MSRPDSRKQVFDTVRRHGPLRATDLVKLAGRASATVTAARRELEQLELIEASKEGFRLGPAMTVLSFSVAREGVRCALVDGHGALRAEAHAEALVLPMRLSAGHGPLEPANLVKVLTGLGRQCLQSPDGPSPAAVGMAWPGQIEFEQDGEAGAYERRESGWYDGLRFDELLAQVQKALGLGALEQTLVNDADGEFLAESRWGVAVGVKNILGIKLAGGIGSSLIVDGAIYEGSTGTVGEIGHLDVDISRVEDERRTDVRLRLAELDWCSCGRATPPHLERYASGRAMAERLVDPEKLADGYEDAVRELSETSPALQHVVRQAGELVGQALAGPALLLEPDMIVVSAFPRADAIEPAIRHELDKQLDTPPAVKLGTSPKEDGFWMPVRGAAAQAQARHLFPKAEALLGASGYAPT